MTDSPSPDPEVLRSLDLADGYLSDAEDVLWTAAAEASVEEVSDPVEELTQDLWELQHELDTLRTEFEDQ